MTEETQKGARILIVDDDLDARETLRFLLERAGYAAAAAQNGRDALELLRSGPRPCLILLDLRMPVMDGWAFLSALHSGELPPVPIVVVSARADGAMDDDLVQGILTKPIDTKRLLDTVRKHCGRTSGEEAP